MVKIVRERGGEFQRLLRARMDEGKLFRMEQHARRGVVGQFLQPGVGLGTISVVTRDGMTEKLEMHANLMRAPGVDLRLDERGGSQPFQHAPARSEERRV